MAWDKHNGRGEAAARRNTVRCAIRNHNGYSALKISIGRHVCERAGLSNSSLVDFFWGYKAHEGWVRIQPSASGRQRLSPTAKGPKASLILVIGALPSWIIKEKRFSLGVRFSIAPDTALEIKVPKEFLVAESVSTDFVDNSAEKSRPKRNSGFTGKDVSSVHN